MIAGIAAGLSAAVFQSITYLLTRHYAEKRAAVGIRHAGLQLTVLGHIWMGLFAAIVAPFVWPAAGVPWARMIGPLACNTLGYGIGQVCQVSALRHAEASRVGPLMTSKLIFSSILVMIYGQPIGDTARFLTMLQWAAVAVCIVAGISISFTGGKMKSRALISIALGAMTFSISDWNINLMIKQMLAVPGVDRFHASLVSGLLSYLTDAACALPLLVWFGSRKLADWRDAGPFGTVWFMGMVSLYAAFASAGILLGQILQCTRGFITIIFAAALMRLGHHHIEPKAPRKVIALRFAAGVLMFIGISLYVVKDNATLRSLLGP